MEKQKRTNHGYNGRKAKYTLTTGYHVDRTLLHSGKESLADVTQYLQSQINMQKHECDCCWCYFCLFPIPIWPEVNINNNQTHSDKIRAPGFLITHKSIYKQ